MKSFLCALKEFNSFEILKILINYETDFKNGLIKNIVSINKFRKII